MNQNTKISLTLQLHQWQEIIGLIGEKMREDEYFNRIEYLYLETIKDDLSKELETTKK